MPRFLILPIIGSGAFNSFIVRRLKWCSGWAWSGRFRTIRAFIRLVRLITPGLFRIVWSTAITNNLGNILGLVPFSLVDSFIKSYWFSVVPFVNVFLVLFKGSFGVRGRGRCILKGNQWSKIMPKLIALLAVNKIGEKWRNILQCALLREFSVPRFFLIAPKPHRFSGSRSNPNGHWTYQVQMARRRLLPLCWVSPDPCFVWYTSLCGYRLDSRLQHFCILRYKTWQGNTCRNWTKLSGKRWAPRTSCRCGKNTWTSSWKVYLNFWIQYLFFSRLVLTRNYWNWDLFWFQN